MTEAATFADPLRAYVVTLRKGRRITQAELARRVGMGERTYVSWERGTTRTLKEHFARAIIKALDGSHEHLESLDRMRPEEAQQLAHEWLALPDSQRLAAQEAAAKFRRVIELADDDPQGLEDIIQQIRQDARSDPEVLSLLRGYLSGLRVVRPRRG